MTALLASWTEISPLCLAGLSAGLNKKNSFLSNSAPIYVQSFCLNATKSFYTQLSLRIGLIVAYIDVLDTQPTSQ
jgi:hypothetical protein